MNPTIITAYSRPHSASSTNAGEFQTPTKERSSSLAVPFLGHLTNSVSIDTNKKLVE